MRHMIAKAKQNKNQDQALAKLLSNILERMSKRKTNKRKEMPSIFRLTQKKLWKRCTPFVIDKALIQFPVSTQSKMLL